MRKKYPRNIASWAAADDRHFKRPIDRSFGTWAARKLRNFLRLLQLVVVKLHTFWLHHHRVRDVFLQDLRCPEQCKIRIIGKIWQDEKMSRMWSISSIYHKRIDITQPYESQKLPLLTENLLKWVNLCKRFFPSGISLNQFCLKFDWSDFHWSSRTFLNYCTTQ